MTCRFKAKAFADHVVNIVKNNEQNTTKQYARLCYIEGNVGAKRFLGAILRIILQKKKDLPCRSFFF